LQGASGAASSSRSGFPAGMGSGSGSGTSAQNVPSQNSSSAPTAYPSATDEKEAMRRRYEEATTRVSRAGTASPVQPAPSAYVPAASWASPAYASPAAHTAAPIAGPSSIQNPPSSYTSANDGKERMRRLYEEANSRVRARTSMSPPVDISDSPPSAPSTNPFRQPTAAGNSATSYPSAEQEKEDMRSRYAEASSAVSRARMPEGGYQREGSVEGTVGGVGNGIEPAPPLPSRPPAEYVNLLSPLSETPVRW
jgi:hypothetical protein